MRRVASDDRAGWINRGRQAPTWVSAVLCALWAVGFLGLGGSLWAQDSRPSFSEWLAGVRDEALARGIRSEVVDEALGSVTEPEPTVIERDRTQAETILPLEKYLARQLTP